MSKIAKKFEKICEKIKGSANNRPIELIAVTKFFTEEVVSEAISLGILNFGENRVQECENKFKNLLKTNTDIKLHLIGPLQTNKAEKALGLFDAIHSLDREKLAIHLKKLIIPSSRTKSFFVQVNIGMEKQKTGVVPSQTKEFVNWCANDLNLNIVGLMCIPPIHQNSKSFFLEMKKLSEICKLKKLSMGMSTDYVEAINCGATHIRLGTALFGERSKK